MTHDHKPGQMVMTPYSKRPSRVVEVDEHAVHVRVSGETIRVLADLVYPAGKK